jgi:hypothetical protein
MRPFSCQFFRSVSSRPGLKLSAGFRGARSSVILSLIALMTACSSAPSPGLDTTVELSYDGLTPLEDTVMTRVWVREGFTLSGYKKVILEGAGIRYRPVTETNSKGQRNAAIEFPVSPAQKAELEALITEEFDRALDRLTLPEVTEPGPDVLLVRGYMLDVVSRIPPANASSSQYFIDSVGQATFVVELIDSQTGTVLVRALDTRSARTPGYTYRSNAATNRAQVQALIARWADLLVDALNDLTAIDELQGA